SHVVTIYTVTCRTTNDQVVRIPQVANQCSHGDVYNIIPKPPAIRPSARNEPAVLERILNAALQHVTAEDAQTRVSGIVWVGWISRSTSGKANFVRRQVDLDQIGNVNACDVRAISLRRNLRIQHK